MIPKLAQTAGGEEMMLEIGDDGQLAAGCASARGAKNRDVSSVCSTPATQESNKNAGAAFQYPAAGASAENSG